MSSRDTQPRSDELDQALDAAWHAHARKSPPPALDAPILDAARRAAISHRAPLIRRRVGWRMPLAAAATLATVVLGIQLTRPDRQLTPQVAVTLPSASLPAPFPAAPSKPAEQDAAGVIDNALPQNAPVREARAKRVMPPPAPALAAQAEGKAADTFAPEDKPRQSKEVESAAAAPAVADETLDAHLVRLHELFTQGHVASAAAELKQLRQRYADVDRRLPPDLRAWAATVPVEPRSE